MYADERDRVRDEGFKSRAWVVDNSGHVLDGLGPALIFLVRATLERVAEVREEPAACASGVDEMNRSRAYDEPSVETAIGGSD